MAQGEFWVERQNWARWPRALKVNRVTDHGTETRSYVPKGKEWEAKDYALRKVAGLKSENAKLRDQLEEQKCFAADLERDVRALRELVLDMWPHVRHRSRMCGECELPCDTSDECLLYEPMRQRMRELGVDE